MKEKLQELVQKYKFVLLVLLAGILLMLLPTGKSQKKEEQTSSNEEFCLAEVEEQMGEILSHMDGVGKVQVMLTLKSGSALQLAADRDATEKEAESKTSDQVVKLNRGSGSQEVVITEKTYPTYQGAVVVCDGADNSHIRLAVIEAVSVLTGLSSDRISVVRWKS